MIDSCYRAILDNIYHSDGPGPERVDVDFPTLDPHKLPKFVRTRGGGKDRFILRQWPRDPMGQKMLESPLRGKEGLIYMREAGELIEKDELAWADKEDDPKEIPVVNIGELVKCCDVRVLSGICNRFPSRKEVRESREEIERISR